jgi:hypothetical protein
MTNNNNSHLIRAIKATFLSVGFNVALFLISRSLGFFPENMTFETPEGTLQGFHAMLIIGATLTFCFLGSLIFFVLDRLMEHGAPWFLALSLIFLMTSLLTPFTIEGAPWSMIITLEIMHISTATILLYFFIPNSFKKI